MNSQGPSVLCIKPRAYLSISPLFNSSEFSDLTITCQGIAFQVHRTVVCVQSQPLAAIINKYFKEGVTAAIELTDEEPQTVELMLKFLYAGSYQVSTPVKAGVEEITQHIRVFALANKYDISRLMAFAVHRLQEMLIRDWKNSSVCLASCLRAVCGETPEDNRLLEYVLGPVATDKGRELTKDEEFAEVCKRAGAAFDLFKAGLDKELALSEKDDKRVEDKAQ